MVAKTKAKAKPKKKRGAPSKFSQRMRNSVCALIAQGLTITLIAARKGMPARANIFKELARNPDFRDQYVRAGEARAHVLAEQVIEISDDSTDDYDLRAKVDKNGNPTGEVVTVVLPELVARSRLRVETRLKLMAAMHPKRYGPKVEATVEGGDKPLQVQHGGAVAMPALEAFTAALAERLKANT